MGGTRSRRDDRARRGGSVLLVATIAAMLAACAPAFQATPLEVTGTVRHFVDVDGVRLHYDDRGKGPPVVLLHGFSSFLAVWDGVAKDLVDGHRVIQVDLPGHGQSDRREGDYTPAGVAKTVFAFLDRLGIDRATVVAHSWGCSVALAMALQAPGRVDRLVLVDGWVYDDQANLFMRWSRAKGVGEGLWNWFYDQHVETRYGMAFHEPGKFLDERAFVAVKRYLGYPGSRAAALAIMRGLATLPGQEKRYGDVKAPSLLIWCREDEVARLPFGERLSNTLPDARLAVIPQCGHMPMVEQPTRFNALVTAFVDDDPLPLAPPEPPDAKGSPARTGGRP